MANDLLSIQDAIAARLAANAGFAGVTIVKLVSGDLAARVAHLKGQTTLVVGIPEPRIMPGRDGRHWDVEFEIFIDENVTVNRRDSSHRRGVDLEMAAMNAVFQPSAAFRPHAMATEVIFDGSDKSAQNYELGRAPVIIEHRALGGHIELTLSRS